MTKKIFILCTIFLTNLSFSQNGEIIVLTLHDAITKALEKNWDIQISKQEIKKSEEQIDEAYSNAFPKIDFTGRYTRNYLLPVLFLPPNPIFGNTQTLAMELGSKNSYDATFSLFQVIYSQKVNTAIQIADEYSEFVKVGTKGTRNEVILNVKKAFYNVLLMRELVKVSKQGYEVAKANYENVSALYKQGIASEYDFLRSEVQLANTQPLLIQTENNLELASNFLKNLLALDLDAKVEVKGVFQFEDMPDAFLNEISADAITNNPFIKQLDLNSSLLEKNLTIEKSEYYPTLALFSQFSYQTQDNSFKFKDYNWAKSFLVGIQLSYPIFDGFKRGARIEQVKIEKDKVDLTRRKIEEGLKIQVLQSRMKMQEAKKRIDAQQKNLEHAEKTLKIAQTRYKSGVGTQLELIDTQAALTFARTNYAQAIYDYQIAKSEWEFAVSLEQ